MEKQLMINQKPIIFKKIDNTYWIALKPICDALELNWVSQFKSVKEHKILKDVLSNQTMHDTKNRLQEMVALPEKYIYGWLFSISSDNDVLLQFQRKCYEILYEYFHKIINERITHLNEKSEIKKQLLTVEAKLNKSEDFNTWQELKAKEMRLGKTLKDLDTQFINTQTSISFEIEE